MNLNQSFERSWIQNYLIPTYYAWRYRKPFREIRSFLLFIGNSRSGTTLVASLLDAHPSAIVSHELDILKYRRFMVFPTVVLGRILNKSRFFAMKGASWQTYNYKMASGWQGRFDQLITIGDKKAHRTSRWLLADPEITTKFQKKIGLPLKFLHVIRNPFDTIATKARKGAGQLRVPSAHDLERTARVYFENMALSQRIAQLENHEILYIRYEKFVAETEDELSRICQFLEISAEKDYMLQALEMVNPDLHQSRKDVEWPTAVIEMVNEEIPKYEELKGYTF